MSSKKVTISELKNYIISEAKKLYDLEILKEEKRKIEKALSEIDKRAMNAAKQDIEKDGGKFEPLGKNKFEKNIDKKELKKAMSPEKMEEKVNPWAVCHASTGPEKDKKFEKCVMDVKKKEHIKEETPSAGLSKKQKSDVVKSTKSGEDIGNKGKGFKDVAAKAEKEYGSKEKGEKVAAASMWKNIKRESDNDSEFKKFKFKIKHDKGYINISTTATDLETAKKKIMNAEGCPESALTYLG